MLLIIFGGMKSKFLLLIIILFGFKTLFSQKEANHWFFGNNASIDFTSGSPVSSNNGQLITVEGCASISDSDGNLLFYTDGTTVYNKNSIPMPNANADLHGNESSTQSAIIVPKPNVDNQFYIFTVDEHNENLFGLQYSLVNMSLDGGLGDIDFNEKNIPLLDHTAEKITAVQGEDCNSIWVITFSSPDGTTNHAYNTFHAFNVTDTGITPSVISIFPRIIDDGRGYIKVSADGTKLCIAHQNQIGQVFLYDFDNVTGNITNETIIQLSDSSHPDNHNFTQPYGIEFSLDTSKLYITSVNDYGTFNALPNDGFLWQIDLTNSSLQPTLISYNVDTYRGALQVGPDGKIYRAISKHYNLGSDFLGTIHHPELDGILCDYEQDAINLGTGLSRQGLPPFIQSLFISDLEITIDTDGIILDSNLDLCIGETFRLEPNTINYPSTTTFEWSQTINGITNILSDTSSFLDIDYASSYADGTYHLEVDFHDGSCLVIGEATISYHQLPILNTPITIRQCDDDTDGISTLDLSILNNEITDFATTETITFYETQANAIAETNPIINYTNYITNTRVIWTSVENEFECSTVGQINIEIINPTTTFHQTFTQCDDFLDTNGNDNENNDDSDGIATFNFDVTSDIISLFPITLQPNLNVEYYQNSSDGLLQINQIENIANYRNINSIGNQTIYIRVNTSLNLDCIGFGDNLTLELIVEPLPIANPVSIENQCDDDQDQQFNFDTSNIANSVLLGQNNVELTYFNEDGSQIPSIGNHLPNPFLTNSQTITIVATNNPSNATDNPCTDTTTLEFIVNNSPFISETPTFETLCDDEPDATDGMSGFNTSLVEYTILGGNTSQVNMDVSYFNEDGTQIFNKNGDSRPLPNPFITATQTITVIVQNPLNTTCPVSTTIDFEVHPSLQFDIVNDVLCLNQLPNPLFVPIINVPPSETYTYTWFDEFGNEITVDSNNQFLDITSAGEYSVTATSTDGNFCTRTKYFSISESNIPTIETVTITDNLPNNQISVLVSGEGDYEFAIDDGLFEANNAENGYIFSNVNEGLRVIHIRDINGCGEITTVVPVIRFPKFLTPNGDGNNDFWQIIGTEAYPFAEFTIFDRYGRVITQFNSNQEGWDGTYLNKIAPLTDYWFLGIFTDVNGKKIERRGHFSLRL